MSQATVCKRVLNLSDIFWINGDPPTGLAIILRPRGDDWLEDELGRMKRGGIEGIVSLLESEEASELGLAEEGTLAAKIGLSYLSHPIPDRHVPPDTAAFRYFVQDLAERLRSGQLIGVHCRGSIGRATLTASCALVHLGWQPQLALEAIEAARGCPVPDTPEQRDWILNYKVGR
jgi:protein-tyrosine phosphatase